MMTLLSSVGAACGILGACLVASSRPTRRAAGFAIWIFGNAAWIGYGAGANSLPMVVQFSVFLVTAMIGLRNNTPQVSL